MRDAAASGTHLVPLYEGSPFVCEECVADCALALVVCTQLSLSTEAAGLCYAAEKLGDSLKASAFKAIRSCVELMLTQHAHNAGARVLSD